MRDVNNAPTLSVRHEFHVALIHKGPGSPLAVTLPVRIVCAASAFPPPPPAPQEVILGAAFAVSEAGMSRDHVWVYMGCSV